MQGNKELKIKLKTVIILMVILLIAVVAIFALIINNEDKIGSKGGSTIVGNESGKQQAMENKIGSKGGNTIVSNESGKQQAMENKIGSKGGNTIVSNESGKQQAMDIDFSMSFLKLENDKQNMIYSPLSIKYALKMLNEGANGNTKTQIENVIRELNLTKYNKLENDKQNMIYSPLSIKYALKMLNESAKGNTKTQIENVIRELILTKYNNFDKVLSLANGVYIRDTYAKYVKEDYKKTLIEKYNAEINYDSFNNANNINNWIENKTLGIIKNMLRDETVQNLDNEMLLINALAIDMEWEDSFYSNDTGESDFYLEDGSTMNATTMHLETSSNSVSYYKDTDITALTMDLKEYNNTQLEFIAIMPKGNLSDYVETFSIDEFDNIIEKSKLASKTKNGVYISIPRFSFDYDLKLKNDLINLGITDAFDEELADFSNISDTGLYVSDALHKANIDFTEKGIKAAAVTVALMTSGTMFEEDKPIEITINKPFLYVIRDKNTSEIWFVGTVYEPNSWENDKASYYEIG